jgi:hypothetical protein
MAFGNADLLRQIIGQLGQLGADLAALKQQVGDQQHAIDLIRQDTTAAINTGLTENRAVIRDGLARTNDTVSGPLANIGNELVAIRGGIGQLDQQMRAAAAPPTPTAQEREPAPEPAPIHDQAPQPARTPEAQAGDETILRAAAGISRATLRAHRDSWAFLVEHAIHDRHFRVPGQVADKDGAVTVHVSGPSLVAAITSLHDVSHSGDSAVTRAIAGHLHDRLTETVQAIVSSPHRGDGADEVEIVIDDRAAAVGNDQPEDDREPAPEPPGKPDGGQ